MKDNGRCGPGKWKEIDGGGFEATRSVFAPSPLSPFHRSALMRDAQEKKEKRHRSLPTQSPSPQPLWRLPLTRHAPPIIHHCVHLYDVSVVLIIETPHHEVCRAVFLPCHIDASTFWVSPRCCRDPSTADDLTCDAIVFPIHEQVK